MKRKMILVPIAILLCYGIWSCFHIIPPNFNFTMKTIHGDAKALQGITYNAVLSDGIQRWDIQGNEDTISYTQRFLNRDEELKRTYKALGSGFYLYLPRLQDGKKISDYEKRDTKKIKREDGEEVELTYYHVDHVNLDLMVSTKNGYACIETDLSQDYSKSNRVELAYDPAKNQLYGQSDYKREGKAKGQGYYHASVVLNDKTYTALYEAGQGSNGQYAIYRIDSSYVSTSDEIPEVEDVKKATKAEKIVEFPPDVSISDIVAYHGKLHVAIQKDRRLVRQTYDVNGKLLEEIALDKKWIFHKYMVVEDKLLVFTSSQNIYNLKIYDKDTLQADIITDTPLNSSVIKLHKDKVAAIDLVQKQDYARLKLYVFDHQKKIYEGELQGDFVEDQSAVEKRREAASDGIILPDEAVREVINFGFE